MKPSEREEEYVARMEFERKKRLEEERRQMKGGGGEEDKGLHYMKCPKCGRELIEIDYKSIEVDKCSGCDGIWLDAGEFEQVAKMEKGALDKLFNVFRR